MFENILVVCVGNICRSPYAEKVLKNRFPSKNITSAGILVDKSNLVGRAMDSTGAEVATERGFDTEHSAKQLTKELCQWADLILVMEDSHIGMISHIAPESTGKTMKIGYFSNFNIPDPHRMSKEMFEYCYNLIEESVETWTYKI